MTEFEPCPICGKKLTDSDISFAMDDGDYCSSVECAEFVTVSCDCGFHFTSNIDALDYFMDGWEDRFKEMANKRFYKSKLIDIEVYADNIKLTLDRIRGRD